MGITLLSFFIYFPDMGSMLTPRCARRVQTDDTPAQQPTRLAPRPHKAHAPSAVGFLR